VGLCSIKFNHSKRSIPSLSSLSSHGQHILNQITLIVDDMKGDRVQDNVYVELSMLEKMRVKDVNQLISKPFSLGKVEEVYTFVKGSLASRCCTDKEPSKARVVDEEHAMEAAPPAAEAAPPAAAPAEAAEPVDAAPAQAQAATQPLPPWLLQKGEEAELEAW